MQSTPPTVFNECFSNFANILGHIENVHASFDGLE